MTIDAVASFLEDLDLDPDVVTLFRENKVDGKALHLMKSHDTLREIGVAAFGDRVKILDATSNTRKPDVAVASSDAVLAKILAKKELPQKGSKGQSADVVNVDDLI
eukprot:gene20489-1088_t